jgi:hypothetical protein
VWYCPTCGRVKKPLPDFPGFTLRDRSNGHGGGEPRRFSWRLHILTSILPTWSCPAGMKIYKRKDRSVQRKFLAAGNQCVPSHQREPLPVSGPPYVQGQPVLSKSIHVITQPNAAVGCPAVVGMQSRSMLRARALLAPPTMPWTNTSAVDEDKTLAPARFSGVAVVFRDIALSCLVGRRGFPSACYALAGIAGPAVPDCVG